MKRWTALSDDDENLRWQALSAELRAKGCENEFVPWEGEFTQLTALDQFDHVRLGRLAAQSVLQHIRVQSSWTTLLGVVDGMNRTPHGWWPLCALFESLYQLLNELGPAMDSRGNVLIAGSGAAARIAIAALFKAGFRDFLVTNWKEDEGQQFIKDIRAKFFGLDIKWVPVHEIVLLPGESSAIINCTPSTADNSLLTELSYLNFLRRSGCLFDLSRGSKPSAIMQEALDAGIRTVSGLDIAARTDVLWASWGFQTEISLDEHRQRMTTP
jgi:hypothetical protein